MDLTGIGSIFDFLSKGLDKIFPDKNEANKAKLEMLRLQQEGAFKELEMEYKTAADQIAVNAKEAENTSVFVSGWRPAVGWCCCFALGYNFIFMPLFTYIAVWVGNAPAMPTLESGELMTLLFGLLGLGGLRSYDKKNGVSSK